MKTAEEAQRGGGPRWWWCSDEWPVAPTCPASRESIEGEEGCGHLRVEVLGATLTGGGGQRRGLDKIQRGGRVLAPGS
jgi:hypothetical protein